MNNPTDTPQANPRDDDTTPGKTDTSKPTEVKAAPKPDPVDDGVEDGASKR